MSTSVYVNWLIVSIIILVTFNTVFRAVSQELNQILNIYSSCNTDIIFTKKPTDIPPPEYPVLISTPNDFNNYTIGSKLIVRIIFMFDDSYLPAFRAPHGTIPQIIKVRINCVALVLLQASTKLDIRRGVQGRHNWIYMHQYEMDKLETDMSPHEQTLFYSGDVFINVICAHGFDKRMFQESPWTWSPIDPIQQAIY